MSDWKVKPLRTVGLVEGWVNVGLCDQQHTAEGLVCHVRDQRVKDGGFFILGSLFSCLFLPSHSQESQRPVLCAQL